MMGSRFAYGLAAALLATVIGAGPGSATDIPVVPYDTYPDFVWGDTAASGTVLFDNGDTAGVGSGPPIPTQFIIPEGSAYLITSITTYHWNGGSGGVPGTLSLQDDHSEVYGPWDASVIDGSYDRWWYVRPGVVIGPGTYTVIDSVPSTWSYTTGGGHTSIKAEAASVDSYQPDGRIRLDDGPSVGNDVYNTTAAGQKRTASVRRGATVTFTAVVGNDGSVADRFTVKAAGSTPGYTVRYLKGSTDITAAIVAGTWRTKLVAAGEGQSITVRVTVRSSAAVGSKVSRKLMITSVGDTTAKDAVRFVVSRR